MVSSSRAILFPYEFCDVKRWEQGLRSALEKAANELGEAIV